MVAVDDLDASFGGFHLNLAIIGEWIVAVQIHLVAFCLEVHVQFFVQFAIFLVETVVYLIKVQSLYGHFAQSQVTDGSIHEFVLRNRHIDGSVWVRGHLASDVCIIRTIGVTYLYGVGANIVAIQLASLWRFTCKE